MTKRAVVGLEAISQPLSHFLVIFWGQLFKVRFADITNHILEVLERFEQIEYAVAKRLVFDEQDVAGCGSEHLSLIIRTFFRPKLEHLWIDDLTLSGISGGTEEEVLTLL